MFDRSADPRPRPDAAEPGASGKSWLRPLALPLAALVFLVDTFLPVQGAIATLYVVVQLLDAQGASRARIRGAALGCGGLTLASFFWVHGHPLSPGPGPDAGAVLRGLVALAAVSVAAAILLRDQALHDRLAGSERRYRAIFVQARFALWEQDFSQARARVDALRAAGVADLHAHLSARPALAAAIAETIVTGEINDAAIELLGAADRTEALTGLNRAVAEDEPGVAEMLAALGEGRRRIERAARLTLPDGSARTAMFAIDFPEDPAELTRVVVAAADVTERDRLHATLTAARAELARASRVSAVGALSAGIAHELSQPLAAVVMSGQTCLRWLRRDPPDLCSAERAAERMVREALRAGDVVQRTRDLLRRDPVAEARADLAQVLRETAELIAPEAAARGARLALTLPPGPLTAGIDATEAQQVLVNLVANALQAMEATPPEARRVEIAACVQVLAFDAGWVEITVRDHGRGLPPGATQRLFEPFHTTRAGGMGMGLAICRSIAEARGGRIDAGPAPGGGAVFTLRLPVCAAPPAASDAALASPDLPPAPGPACAVTLDPPDAPTS